MPMNYTADLVRIAYHHAYKGDYDPSANDLRDHDDYLFHKYDSKLLQLMPNYSIVVNKRSRSILALLAEIGHGSSISERAENACRYYSKAWSFAL